MIGILKKFFSLLHLFLKCGCNNPNTFAGLVGKVRETTISRRRKEGRVEKKARAARPWGPGFEPGTCGVLGEGPQLHVEGGGGCLDKQAFPCIWAFLAKVKQKNPLASFFESLFSNLSFCLLECTHLEVYRCKIATP